MNDGRGTSLVITRTDKGRELFGRIKSEWKWKEVSYEEGVRGNPSEKSCLVPWKDNNRHNLIVIYGCKSRA